MLRFLIVVMSLVMLTAILGWTGLLPALQPAAKTFFFLLIALLAVSLGALLFRGLPGSRSGPGE